MTVGTTLCLLLLIITWRIPLWSAFSTALLRARTFESDVAASLRNWPLVSLWMLLWKLTTDTLRWLTVVPLSLWTVVPRLGSLLFVARMLTCPFTSDLPAVGGSACYWVAGSVVLS